MINGLTKHESNLLRKLKNPVKIQDYLDSLKINFELNGETCSSPRLVVSRGTAHCIEAAIFAAAVIKLHGGRPLLMDLKSDRRDYDHVVCLYKQGGKWGALSKSNHPALRFRDAVYNSVRELAMSYFHEYLSKTGHKTLRSYSSPFNLNQYDDSWILADYDLWIIANDLDKSKHYAILPAKFVPRPANQFETKANNLKEW
jgi:hypothetical protein